MGLAVAVCSPAARAQSCLAAADRQAFDVRALQSQLMVAAITCGMEQPYNQFVRRHQGELRRAWSTIQGHFRRRGEGQGGTDRYITGLANTHSQDSLRYGDAFCRSVGGLFDAALAAPNGVALQQLTLTGQISTLQDAPACTRPAPLRVATTNGR